jgi:alanine dehydrogenase
MTALELTYLGGADIEALELTDDEVLDSVRKVLAAQGRSETVIEPRTHLFAPGVSGHFNVLRGATAQHAGVKVVGDYVDNHLRGLPSELALLLLMDLETGVPIAIIDATAITEIRTGAVTAIGAEVLARKDARSLGHIGARGTSYWNVRLLCRVLPALADIRVHSRRPESREAFGKRLSADLQREVRVVHSWEECVRGADVVVEASRLTEPAPLLRTRWIATSMPSLDRSSPAPRPGVSARTRRSCSGTAGSPPPTSLSARPTWRRPAVSGRERGCPTGPDGSGRQQPLEERPVAL